MFIICRRTKSKQFSSVCQIKTGLSIQIGFFSPPTPLISHFLSLQSVIFRHFLSRLLLSNKRGCHLSPIHPKWNWLVEVQQAQLTLITTITFSVMLTCLFNPYLFVSVPVCPNIVTCETDSLRVKALELFIFNWTFLNCHIFCAQLVWTSASAGRKVHRRHLTAPQCSTLCQYHC